MRNDYLYEENKDKYKENQVHQDHCDIKPKEPTHIDVYKDVEKFKLGIWIAKTFSVFVLFIVTSLVVSYLYISITTQQLADLSAASALLSGFFEVIKVIVSP